MLVIKAIRMLNRKNDFGAYFELFSTNTRKNTNNRFASAIRTENPIKLDIGAIYPCPVS
jgi:hypothetical protein